MAEAPTLDTLTPKQLGKHLRAVRRRKGLSQSEVARGAGLTRRELNAYEKGRITIPDSDLFVLAGSCGVDVSELRVAASAPQLEAPPVTAAPTPVAPAPMPSSIEDTVAQLRRSQEVALAPVPSVNGRRRARAIEAANEPAPASQRGLAEGGWSVEEIDPLDAVQWPGDASIPSPATSTTPAPAEPVDVFEELARLPEPSPLPADGTNDVFAPFPELLTPPPAGAIEDIDAQPYDEWPTFEADYESEFETDGTGEGSEPVLVEMPNAQSSVADLTSAADAPPIDIAMRSEAYASPWDSLQGNSGFDTPIDAPIETPFDAPIEAPFGTPTDTSYTPGGFAPEPVQPTWDTSWSEQSPDLAAPDAGNGSATQDLPGAWEHQPDPEATSTGFYIDWGDADGDAAPAAEPGSPWDPLAQRPLGEPEPVTYEPETYQTETYQTEAYEPAVVEAIVDEPAPFALYTIEAEAAPEPETESEVELEAADDRDDDPPPISWRPQWDEPVAPATDTVAFVVDDPPVSEPEERFVVAGAEWVLGNAVPLVEVRGTGGLVMRRADERWALADVTAASDFALEAYVDLRSGPGFGLLFRAVIDDDGRMSGYSFDIDPVYEGGSYLVREWRSDRELWNPIARVPAPDPGAMHGLLAVRITVDDDRLVASVNGDVVLEVESLKQASSDRGRDGASGDRVGIQAWSSTDLVIDELRVAQR